MAKTKPADQPQLPEPLDRPYQPFDAQASGRWLILSDVHLPFHDRGVLELAVAEASRRGVKGVLLNGDILDAHQLSRFDKRPDDVRFVEEIRQGREFLRWLRARLPKARIVWRDGNHDARLFNFLCNKAPELFGLDVLQLPNLLRFGETGTEYVTDMRVITLGRLHVVHGHEYRPGITVPVNPARGLFLRAKGNALCGHFHQTSEHHEPTIAGKPQGCWSTGCCCQLNPPYCPLSRWNHGFAFCEVGAAGQFSVQNLRVLDGEVV